MQKTKIDWCDMTFNPVTGCLHECPYCYAADIARRFGGMDSCMENDSKVVWDNDCVEVLAPCYRTTKDGEKIYAPYPFGFVPTLHWYRLDEPQKVTKSKNIFVCSMADLFGEWVPTRWIRDVLDACAAAPQNRYLFLTKNPARYNHLIDAGVLPLRKNFWYGFSAEGHKQAKQIELMPWFHGYGVRKHRHEEGFALNTFMSLEPLLHPIFMPGAFGGGLLTYPKWVIIGAETGKRKDKIIPRREWVDDITKFCDNHNIPVFYKDSLRKLFPDLPPSKSPWEDAL